MTVRIDTIGPADHGRWRALRHRALAADPDCFAAAAHAHPDAQPALAMFVAVDDRGDDVGLAGLGAGRELVSMWVAPQARRSGVGRALVSAVLAAAADQPVRLRVMAGNGAATRFYAGLGFRPVSTTADEDGTVTMVRDASPAPTVWSRPAGRPPRPGAPRPGRSADQ